MSLPINNLWYVIFIESPHAKPMMEELPTEALETNAHGVIKQGKEKTAKKQYR